LPCDPRTFDPDTAAHRFHQLFADVEAQACSSNGTGQVALQPHKFPKEQRNILRRNTGTVISHADAYLRDAIQRLGGRIALRGYNLYRSLRRSIFESVGEQIAQHPADGLVIRLHDKPLSNLQMDGVLLPLQRLKLFENLVHEVGHYKLPGDWSSDVCSSDLCIQNGVDQLLQSFAALRRLEGERRPLLTRERVVEVS